MACAVPDAGVACVLYCIDGVHQAEAFNVRDGSFFYLRQNRGFYAYRVAALFQNFSGIGTTGVDLTDVATVNG